MENHVLLNNYLMVIYNYEFINHLLTIKILEQHMYLGMNIFSIYHINLDHVITSLHIVNMLGQNVLSLSPNAKEFTIDVSTLSSGAYFIKAISNGVITTKKLVRK